MPRKNQQDRLEYQREYQKEWYQSNKQKRIAQNKISYYKYKDWFYDVKSKYKCCKCGEDHPAVIDFHHREPSDKKMGISLMIARFASKESVLAEIEKCDALCSNCHRKIHWELHRQQSEETRAKWEGLAPDSVSRPAIKTCQFCNQTEDHTDKWRNGKTCTQCYNSKQKEKMRLRRKNA